MFLASGSYDHLHILHMISFSFQTFEWRSWVVYSRLPSPNLATSFFTPFIIFMLCNEQLVASSIPAFKDPVAPECKTNFSHQWCLPGQERRILLCLCGCMLDWSAFFRTRPLASLDSKPELDGTVQEQTVWTTCQLANLPNVMDTKWMLHCNPYLPNLWPLALPLLAQQTHSQDLDLPTQHMPSQYE